jgi:hypothetical protein
MNQDTISVITSGDPAPLAVAPSIEGARAGTANLHSWAGEPATPAASAPGVVRNVPVERLEQEMEKLVAVMNRMVSHAELTPPAEAPDPASVEPAKAKSLRLNQIKLTVEVNGEGGLSILGTGGKIGGKGGITLTFSRE